MRNVKERKSRNRHWARFVRALSGVTNVTIKNKMPFTTTNESGEEIEVFTSEELEAQKDAAIEEFKQANPDKTGELEVLQAELKTTQEKLAKFEDKDLNFANLRAQKEVAEKKAKDLASEIDTKIGAAKKEIFEGVMQDHYNQVLESLAGTDEELKKKIEFQYKRLGDSTTTKDQVTKKMTDAWALATRTEDSGILNSTVISSGGVSRPNVKSAQSFTPEEKAIAQKLASAGGLGQLTDQDFK